MSLTYLGHSAFKFELGSLTLYIDPYIRDPIDWRRLPSGDFVLYTHGHFDHGVLMAPQLYQKWRCRFVGPRTLVSWMSKKYRRVIPAEAYVAVNAGESVRLGDLTVRAVPAHHPLNRLGKTILSLFARSSAPGNPVNGYFFQGYYHAGDTVYSSAIAEALRGEVVHTACLPIGGKYKVASPQEALRIADEVGAQRIVPMHWQPLLEQVPFRYQPSDLIRAARESGSRATICPLAIGEKLESPQAERKTALDETAVRE